ncbi:MAG: hypothetical protein VB031_01065 [Eubacteriaceae bacterium]|nr:hypothetical protein [Eubacteriaceae bacterium]
MKNNRYKLGGLKTAVIGLVVIALDQLALEAVRMFRTWNLAEFGYMGLLLLSWFLILMGTNKIKKYHPAFARTMICAAVMMAVVFIEAMMAYGNINNNMGDQAFISFNVMLMNYITIIGMFYTYYRLLQGAASLARRNGSEKIAVKCDGRGKKSFVIIMICFILIPISGMFDPNIEYAATGVMGLIVLAAQLRLCMLMLRAYDKVYGKEVR